MTAYTYDGVGRLQQATWDGQTATFGYDAGGNRTSISLPGSVSVSYTYDLNNRLTALVNRNGSGVLSSYSYTYDKVGNRLSETTTSGTTGYQYDDRNQLIGVTAPGGAQTTYTYDAVGNRLSTSDASGQTSYTYDAANRLTQTASGGVTKSFTWDAAGNQLGDGTLSYSYDGLNRLVGVTGAGKTISYTYDGDSLLWDRQENGAKSRFYLNGDRVINEGDGAGAIAASMFQTASVNLGRKVGSAAYMLYNGHGDLTGVTDGGGAQVAGYQYDAFGNLVGQSGSYATSFLYTGEYFDSGAALYYLRARFYSPGLGRFLTQDTYLGEPREPGTQHLYAYVRNTPVNWVDPTGHVPSRTHVTLDGGWGGAPDPEYQEELRQEIAQELFKAQERTDRAAAFDTALYDRSFTTFSDSTDRWATAFVGCKLGSGNFETCLAAFNAAGAHGVDLSGTTLPETFILWFHPEAALMAPGDLAGAMEMVLGAGMVQGAFSVGGEMKLGNTPAGKMLVGSALKGDIHHGFPAMIDEMAVFGRRFTISNKSGMRYDLWQVEGALNGASGVFEWILDSQAVYHRRFIPGGTMTGFPNQVPKK